jgi:hypothetical protein
MGPSEENQSANTIKDLGDEILKILNERTENPADAFVLMQQLSVYLWSTYKIDWKNHGEHKVAETRKQRYMDFVSGLVDTMTTSEENVDSST